VNKCKGQLLACALLALACSARAQNIGPGPLYCNASFQVSQGAVALTRIVAAVGKVISLCGWSVNAGAAAGTAQLEYGTGTNCGTGTIAVTPAYALGINGVLVDHPGAANFSLPQGADLCLVTTGTGPVQLVVYYILQ
jgi:hypothetical protein